ncbi:MAG: Holliday junction branch migration DNA helicase RuvB [Patescibacteria group bacterium]
MSSTKPEKDWFLDSALRPALWDDYIGQNHIKDNLKILLTAARERAHPPEHLLFYGPPGLGKTTLAHLIAKEIGAQIKVTSGPAIERVGDLASILSNLSAGDILFIDEVHRLNKMIEEVLYPAMESGTLNIIIGKGPGARVIQLDLPPFTLIAATTRVALLSSPLRSRFSGGTFRLDFYTADELMAIVQRSAKILEIAVTPEAAKIIAERSRFTPRLANHLLKRCRDFAQMQKKEVVDESIVRSTLNLMGVDEHGLNGADRQVLGVIIEKFGGGPVGLGTIAAAASEEEATIEEVHEPYLLQLGFIERTPRGRLVTKKAYDHLGFDFPRDRQERLL